MAFSAPPGADTDVDVDTDGPVALDGAIASVADSELGPEPTASPDGDADARGHVGDDLVDLTVGDALPDAAREVQLQLAAAGVPPELSEMQGLPEREAVYARAARAANTLRDYRSDWTNFTTWRIAHDAEPMPAGPAALPCSPWPWRRPAPRSAPSPAGITEGPVFRGATKPNRAAERRLHPKSVTTLIKGAWPAPAPPPLATAGTPCRRGSSPTPTYGGPSDRAIAHQTRLRLMASLGGYVRVSLSWIDNAATGLELFADPDQRREVPARTPYRRGMWT